MDIAIYFEGGGNSAETRATLRSGMSGFLKPLADIVQRRGRWSITCCGGRDRALDAFLDALENEPEVFNVLLVDSEGPVTTLPRAHLRQRDKWDLGSATEEQVHLMAQCMETWLVADPEALADYYGQEFKSGALPRRLNLEEEDKTRICSALENATGNTQKGAYGKIKHASKLLCLVRHENVKARCRHCQRLFATLEAKIRAEV